MMIPLRRAFIVKQHGTLTYPEGTACAEVLIAGEMGGSPARMVFVGCAVAPVGISAICRAWPPISSSIVSGLRDLRATRAGAQQATRRTERDMSMSVVLFGSIGMVLVLMCIPAMGLGITFTGFIGAMMIL